VLSYNISDYWITKKIDTRNPNNTIVNLNISDSYKPAFMQMNKRFYLISSHKKFSNQFSVPFLIILDK